MSEKTKVVHAELKGTLSSRFDIIKEKLGIQNDAEVVRFLVQHYYRANFEPAEITAKEEVKGDREKIRQFIQKYGEEWRKLGEDT